MKLIPRRWSDFQHYKDRRPPWIKLHKALLDDREYQRLPLASRALAPMLWLLASESEDGVFEASTEELTFRLRQPAKEIDAGLAPLIESGFFTVVQGASTPLAERQQLAVPEERQRRDRGEAEGEPQGKPASALKAKREKQPELTFADWSDRLKATGEKLISESSVWAYAASINLPDDFVRIAWFKFKTRYLSDPAYSKKKYADWRKTFRNAVEGNWLSLWHFKAGEFHLSTAGGQASLELDAYEKSMIGQEVAA